MVFRSIALTAALGLASAHGAEQWEQNALNSIHTVYDVVRSSPMFTDNGIQLPHRHARQEASVCTPDTSQTLQRLFPSGQAGFQAFMQECGQFYGTFGNVFMSPENAESVCMNSCLPSMLRIFGAYASAIPSGEACAAQRRLYSGIPNMIQSVLCSRNHLGIRCGAVMGSFATERTAAATAAAAGGSAITAGNAESTMFGWTVPASNSSLYAGMCGTFDVAGCCMKTSVSSILGLLTPELSGAADIVTSLDSSLSIIKTTCTDANLAHTNIGADACPIGTTRNGGITDASVASAPAALAIRRRLRLVFAGDLSTIPAAQQETIKAYIKDKVEAALGVGTVESVVLSSGSISASVTMSADVSAEEVDALTADASIIEMAPPSDANGGTLTQTVRPSTVVESTSGAVSVVSSVLATAAAAATVLYVL